jgi:hypothetical protein
MIDFNLVEVSPAMARKYLEKNLPENRKVRMSTVAAYTRDMQAGRWQLSHQCIALNEKGQLIDGQHRLHALIQAGVTVPMYVAQYQDGQGKFQILDGGAKRNAIDVLKCNKKDQETARLLWRAANHETPTISEIDFVLNRCRDVINATTRASSSNRLRSSAPVRTAFAIAMHMHPGESESLRRQLAAFAALDAANLWPSLLCIVKRFDKSPESQEWYRNQVFSALLPSNRQKDKPQVNVDLVNETIRTTAREMIGVAK